MEDEDLEDGAKLLFARISQYSQEGRCWASNNHFAEKHKVDIRTIQRWLKQLKDAGHIHIDVQTGGFQTSRDIWISNDFKKMFTKRHACHPSTSPVSSPPATDVVHISIKDNNKEIKKSPTSSSPSADAEVLSLLLFEIIKKTKPNFREPNIEKWSREIDKMIRVDKISPQRIQTIIEWLPTNDFWKVNILSPEKLRLQFDKLELIFAQDAEIDWVKENQRFACECKEKYPQRLKSLIFKRDYLINKDNGKEVSLKMNPKSFKGPFLHIFGGQHDGD